MVPMTRRPGFTGRDYGVRVTVLARVRPRLRNAGVLTRAHWRARVGALRHKAQAAEVERYCCFVGFPRSGTSLTGQLLNAHRHVVVSHESNSIRLLEEFGVNR